jgi:hypothetical protein
LRRTEDCRLQSMVCENGVCVPVTEELCNGIDKTAAQEKK